MRWIAGSPTKKRRTGPVMTAALTANGTVVLAGVLSAAKQLGDQSIVDPVELPDEFFRAPLGTEFLG
jgi:hypothetical protein